VQKGAVQLLSRLRTIKYRSELETAFVRYVRALDSRDHSDSFAGIWSVLEYVTASVGEYKQLIKRVSFLYSDKDRRFIRLLLEHLRDARNRLVHADEVGSNIETYLYRLKGMTELMIRHHLRRGNSYPSLATVAEYLDTPVDRELLKRRICDYRRVLRHKRWKWRGRRSLCGRD
jgi:hypothetical protein